MLKDFTKDMPNIKALQGNYKGLYRLRILQARVFVV